MGHCSDHAKPWGSSTRTLQLIRSESKVIMGSWERANLQDTWGNLWDCVKLIRGCFKRTVRVCESSYGMFRGKDKNGEREGWGCLSVGYWRGWGCWSHVRMLCIFPAKPCTWSSQSALPASSSLFLIFYLGVCSLPMCDICSLQPKQQVR